MLIFNGKYNFLFPSPPVSSRFQLAGFVVVPTSFHSVCNFYLKFHIWMSRSEAKKVLKYIKKGSVSKLRNFVRQNDVNLNKIRDSQTRSALHLACYLGEGRIAKCLLRCGADPCAIDDFGNTPLHTALEYALEFNSETVFLELVVPLKKKCKRVMHLKNKQGITPEELLVKLKEAMKEEVLVEEEKVEIKEEGKEEEKEWLEKLAFEYSCEDFYFKEDSPSHDEPTETYNEWADRIRRDYHTKRSRTNNLESKLTKWKEEKKKEEDLWETVTEKLEKDHQCYVQRIQQRSKARSEKDKEKYEERCEDVFKKESKEEMTFGDVPWPCDGSAVDIVEKLAEWAGEKDRIRYLKLQRIQWHPDKFLQRCKRRMNEKDREQIMDLVKQISQGINALIASL